MHGNLCLSRRESESVVITVPPSTLPQKITVAVARIEDAKVRLAFNADKEVIVDRSEVAALRAG